MDSGTAVLGKVKITVSEGDLLVFAFSYIRADSQSAFANGDRIGNDQPWRGIGNTFGTRDIARIKSAASRLDQAVIDVLPSLKGGDSY